MSFGEELSGSMGLIEISSFGHDFLYMKGERERFSFWFWDKEHNNQTFQRVLLEGQLLDLLLYIFL